MNLKKLAADEAIKLIEDGMTVGLGTGSTAYWAIIGLGERVKEGLRIRAVATSEASDKLARELNIPIIPFSEVQSIDITIDGADETDRSLNLIKGGGGALLREKIVASSSKKLVIIADESKVVDRLGKFPLPVDVVPFAVELTLNKLAALGCEPKLRLKENGELFKTDNGNYVADCPFGSIADPAALHDQLNNIAGVVDNGLFIGMADRVLVGRQDGTVSVLK